MTEENKNETTATETNPAERGVDAQGGCYTQQEPQGEAPAKDYGEQDPVAAEAAAGGPASEAAAAKSEASGTADAPAEEEKSDLSPEQEAKLAEYAAAPNIDEATLKVIADGVTDALKPHGVCGFRIVIVQHRAGASLMSTGGGATAAAREFNGTSVMGMLVHETQRAMLQAAMPC